MDLLTQDALIRAVNAAGQIVVIHSIYFADSSYADLVEGVWQSMTSVGECEAAEFIAGIKAERRGD